MRTWFLICLILLANSTIKAIDVNVMQTGAVGDGKNDDASAIQKAIDSCCNAGGGTVFLPSNKTFMAGPIETENPM